MKVINPINLFSRLLSFLKEVRLETKKVNWPTKEQTIKDTLIVVVFSVAVAIFLSIFDFIFQLLLEKFIAT
ncbi:MAG: preprotein translocase subunit SecE [Patescibacteria group bacterium]